MGNCSQRAPPLPLWGARSGRHGKSRKDKQGSDERGPAWGAARIRGGEEAEPLKTWQAPGRGSSPVPPMKVLGSNPQNNTLLLRNFVFSCAWIGAFSFEQLQARARVPARQLFLQGGVGLGTRGLGGDAIRLCAHIVLFPSFPTAGHPVVLWLLIGVAHWRFSVGAWWLCGLRRGQGAAHVMLKGRAELVLF